MRLAPMNVYFLYGEIVTEYAKYYGLNTHSIIFFGFGAVFVYPYGTIFSKARPSTRGNG